MTPEIQKTVALFVANIIGSIDNKTVLEIGSLNVNGGVKQFFQGSKYTGIDMTQGEGVDIVMNAHDIGGMKSLSFDVVICLETLEHDKEFWTTLSHIRRVLKKDGYFICSTPANGFPYHAYPRDYFRFTQDAYEDIIMESLTIIHLGTVVDTAGNLGLICIGKK